MACHHNVLVRARSHQYLSVGYQASARLDTDVRPSDEQVDIHRRLTFCRPGDGMPSELRLGAIQNQICLRLSVEAYSTQSQYSRLF